MKIYEACEESAIFVERSPLETFTMINLTSGNLITTGIPQQLIVVLWLPIS